MTFIILAKDVVTFGSFNNIDGDGHENDKKSVRLGQQNNLRGNPLGN